MRKRDAAGLAAALLTSVLVANCGPCPPVPCALQTAVLVDVFSTTGDPVTGATVQSSGAVTTTPIQCQGGPLRNECSIPGGAGTYDLHVSAPGFRDTTQSVTVPATPKACSCAVTTQTIRVTLTSAGSG